jgi:aminocarboxymuconate-semialdehyde decarboxylase
MGPIDFHAHLAAGDPSKEPPFLRAMFDPEGYLEHQEAAGVEMTLLSNALMADTPGDELIEAQRQHEFLADLVDRHPDHFLALAGVDPWGGRRWLDEAERALDAGFAGIVVEPSREGRYLDAPEVKDTFALANERSGLIFVHPSRSPISDQQSGDPFLTLWIGRPYDTGICLCRMLMADTLGPYPNVKVVIAHAGGVAPMLLGRLDRVHDVRKMIAAFAGGGGGPPGGGPPGGGGGPPGGGPPGGGGGPPGGSDSDGSHALVTALEGARPSERMRAFYLDTACYHPAGVAAAIAAVGVDHVVFGSDHPPVDPSPGPSLQLIMEMGFSEEDRDKILSGNARGLLGR